MLGHHKPVDSELTKFQREIGFTGLLEWVKDGPEQAMEVARDLFRKRGWELPIVPLESCKAKVGVHTLDLMIGELTHGGPKSRPLFAVLKSLLMVSDWWASATPDPTTVVVKSHAFVPSELMRDSIREEIAVAGNSFQGFRPFQEKCSGLTGHVIAVAPTG